MKFLGGKTSGKLRATKEEVVEHLGQVHSDPRKEDSLEEMERLIKPVEPTFPFKVQEPSWQEVNNFLKKARGKSAQWHPIQGVQVSQKAQEPTLEATESSMEEELPC